MTLRGAAAGRGFPVVWRRAAVKMVGERGVESLGMVELGR